MNHPIQYACLSLLLLLSMFVSAPLADEILWTDEERAEHSTAVFTGTVESVDIFSQINESEHLLRAVVVVESASKGDHLVGDDKLAVYFESPTNRLVDARCPTYVALEAGQRRTFYLRVRIIDGEWRAFIEMGSDVREPAPEEGKKREEAGRMG